MAWGKIKTDGFQQCTGFGSLGVKVTVSQDSALQESVPSLPSPLLHGSSSSFSPLPQQGWVLYKLVLIHCIALQMK